MKFQTEITNNLGSIAEGKINTSRFLGTCLNDKCKINSRAYMVNGYSGPQSRYG